MKVKRRVPEEGENTQPNDKNQKRGVTFVANAEDSISNKKLNVNISISENLP